MRRGGRRRVRALPAGRLRGQGARGGRPAGDVLALSARPRLLALRALKLGDLLTAVPALRALARAFPDHERCLAVPQALGPLVHHLGVVDAVVDTPSLEHPGRFWPGEGARGQRGYGPEHGVDVAVNLHGRGPQSTALVASLQPQRLIAFDTAAGAPRWRADEHEVHRWCRLLEESGIPADPTDLRVDPPPVASRAPAGASVVHPGAASGARRWPLDRWAEVARAEVAAGRDVVITGGPDEAPLAAALAGAAGLDRAGVLAGRTDVLELLALVAAAGRVLCGDTGVAHVAAATGTPSVVLFGPVPPSQWGPPDDPRHVALWAGRHGDPHGTEVDPGLLAITVDDVLTAIDRLPARHASSA